jgi:DNA modification methylase
VSLFPHYEISTVRDLDFAKADTFYVTHRMHSFSAKFPPQLADWGLETFSQPGDWVLDPFVGSGTSLVEARLKGRNSFGIDIDPLSRLMSKVKSTPIDLKVLDKGVMSVLSELGNIKAELQLARARGTVENLLKRYHADIPDFPNRDYWFLKPVQEELALLKALINKQSPPDFVDFLCIVFSSIIITKGKTSVANVRDLAHSRPHYAAPTETPDAFKQFEIRLERLTGNLVEFIQRCDWSVQSKVIGEDARRVPLPDDSIDLIFTSPPYVNAIDYPRAHKFSVFWLADFLHITPDTYAELGREFVGTDRVSKAEYGQIMKSCSAIGILSETISCLAANDIKSASVAGKYFMDMGTAITEMARVLRPSGKAIIVVSPSTIKNIDVATHQILATIAESLRIPNRKSGKHYTFKVDEIALRILDDSKRQLPYLRGSNGSGMRNEYVIILSKVEV